MRARTEPEAPTATPPEEARPGNIRLLRNAMVPLAHEDGSPRGGVGPYRPVLHACEHCQARCCRYNVSLALGDVLRYCQTLGLPFFAGLCIVPSEHPRHAFRVDLDRRVDTTFVPWKGSGEIHLRRRPDGACHGLIEVGGHERCGVYAARPSHCRTYPFAWQSGTARGHPGMIACPIPYGVTPADERRAISDIEHSLALWTHHDAVVAEWHEPRFDGDRRLETFLAFGLRRTAERLGLPLDPIPLEDDLRDRLGRAMLRSGVLAPASALSAMVGRGDPNPSG